MTNNEKQKILFADQTEVFGAVTADLKAIKKKLPSLLEDEAWDKRTVTASEIIAQLNDICNKAQRGVRLAEKYLEEGPYEGQVKGFTPLEAMGR